MRFPHQLGTWADLTGLLSIALAAGIAILAWLKTPFTWLFGFFFDETLARIMAEGFITTITVGFCSILGGTILGFAIAYGMRLILRAPWPATRILVQALLYVALAIPVYVLLVYLAPFFSSPWWASVVILTANLAVFVAKLVLSAFGALPRSQIEAAIASGAHGFTLWWNYERSALWRICGPGIVNEWATTFKLSSLVGLIGTYDIMKAAKISLEHDYNVGVFTAVIIVYVILIVPLCIIADKMAARS